MGDMCKHEDLNNWMSMNLSDYISSPCFEGLCLAAPNECMKLADSFKLSLYPFPSTYILMIKLICERLLKITKDKNRTIMAIYTIIKAI